MSAEGRRFSWSIKRTAGGWFHTMAPMKTMQKALMPWHSRPGLMP